MRKLASIQKVLNAEAIDGADRIVKITVQGWELVAKKDEFKAGDDCVYIEIDSIVPDIPEFEFLRDRKFRVRTIKLRKQISQGLALPLTILPKGKYQEGDDVTEVLGVKKYDPQGDKERELLNKQLDNTKNPLKKYLSRYKWFRKLTTKPSKTSFPSFISKTDETRIQNLTRLHSEEQGTVFEVTEKLDGQSATYYLRKQPKKWYKFNKGFEFGVCSRNLQLTKEDSSSYWTVAKEVKIKDKLESLIGDNESVVLQGEIIGNGIQGNKYKVEGYDFYAFNLIKDGKKIKGTEATGILKELDIKFVPILSTDFKLKESIKETVNYAKGKSVLLDTLREGIVIRNYDKNISFKAINPDFLLKNE